MIINAEQAEEVTALDAALGLPELRGAAMKTSSPIATGWPPS